MAKYRKKPIVVEAERTDKTVYKLPNLGGF